MSCGFASIQPFLMRVSHDSHMPDLVELPQLKFLWFERGKSCMSRDSPRTDWLRLRAECQAALQH